MSTLNELKNTLAKELYGISREDALERRICIDCKQPALSRCTSTLGRKEYRISGLCEVCYDKMFER